MRERRGREERAQWRREQLDARLRVKLERLTELLNDLVPRAQRDGPFAVLEDFLVRTNMLHDLIAVQTPESQRTVLALARLMRFVSEWQMSHPRDSLRDFVGYLDLYQEVGGDLDMDQQGRVDVDGRSADDRLPGQGPRVRGCGRAAPRRGPVSRHARRADAHPG